MKLEEVVLRGTRAAQPAATAVPAGTQYYVTDESLKERSNGSAWESYSGAAGVANPVTSASTITDNRVVRGDGGSRGVQQTGITVDDSDNVSGMASLTLTNTGLHLLDTNATHDLIIAPGSNLTADRTLTVTTGDADRTLTLPLTSAIGMIIDGGGSTITTGVKGYIEVPFACTITGVTLLADQSGSIVVDIWKDTYANYPPTDADSITASAVPTISSATKSQDTALTGWTTSVSAGDILGVNVDSVTTHTRVTLSLSVNRT